MKITFLGDIHARLPAAGRITYPENTTVVQVGDLGMGFEYYDTDGEWKYITENTILKNYGIDYFIRGNHDSPEGCRNHPAYLGDYGYDEKLGIFYMSGAHSIDDYNRIEGVSWWRDEELSYGMTCEAVELYNEVKPRIVLTHDCPTLIAPAMGLIREKDNTNTNHALLAMFESHKPEHWIFGHYHQDKIKNILGTNFVCVGIDSTFTLDTIG